MKQNHYPAFLAYFGNHHKWLDLPTQLRGGPVSFRAHLGKPLTEALWDDLRMRLCVVVLKVFRSGDEIKTVGHIGGPGAYIHLDENELVADVEYYR